MIMWAMVITLIIITVMIMIIMITILITIGKTNNLCVGSKTRSDLILGNATQLQVRKF